MKNKLHYSGLAFRDLDEIQEYIMTETMNSDAADNVVNNILNTIETLEMFSEAGASLDGFVPFESDWRMLVAGTYLVFYRVYGKDVFIDRIIHSKRNYIRILFGDGE